MKLFVSYARVDKPLCKHVVSHLEDVHEVWYDKRLHAGQAWWDEIVERLNWCEGFIYLLSPESVDSEYCKKEFGLAEKAGKHLFPVLIQARTPIPESLAHIHYADLSQGMEDIITLMNALTIAERQGRKASTPISSTPVEEKPQPLSPNDALSKAADAMDDEQFDSAVFIIKGALEQRPSGRSARLLENMLQEAETALEQQIYLREAAREYAPILAAARRNSTRRIACEEFADFQQHFPDYDPDNLSALCEEIFSPPLPSTPKKPTSESLMPAPFAWVHIPEGKVKLVPDNRDKQMSYLKETVTNDTLAFHIAKYPITNTQFAHFIEAGGYENPDWWTEAGWETRKQGYDFDNLSRKFKATGEAWTQPLYWEDKRWNGADYPVVGVSWYEAIAFCLWLSDSTGEKIMLPTEQQWQRAAQGGDRRDYPWGNDWDCKRCNNSLQPCESSETTSIIVYEGKSKGDSPFGVTDMAGNVWEWCLTSYETGEQNIDIDNKYYVLKGGAWDSLSYKYFSAHNRGFEYTYRRYNNGGFRISRLSF